MEILLNTVHSCVEADRKTVDPYGFFVITHLSAEVHIENMLNNISLMVHPVKQ